MSNETYPEEILRKSQVKLVESLPHNLAKVVSRLFEWKIICRNEKFNITTKSENNPTKASRDLLDLLHGKGAKACAALIYVLRYDFSDLGESRCLEILKQVNWERLRRYKEEEWEAGLETQMSNCELHNNPSSSEKSRCTQTKETQTDQGKPGCASAEGPEKSSDTQTKETQMDDIKDGCAPAENPDKVETPEQEKKLPKILINILQELGDEDYNQLCYYLRHKQVPGLEELSFKEHFKEIRTDLATSLLQHKPTGLESCMIKALELINRHDLIKQLVPFNKS